MNQPLHLKYRPLTLNDVVGQDEIVDSLRASLRKGDRSHAFLLTGPSGTGKTTLARIIAGDVGCEPDNVHEVDAASNSGIDAMREIVAQSRYLGFGANPNRALVIDECHALSKQAWQALLKPVEEPPDHVFFMLCTTDPGKVPDTVATRCQVYRLREVPAKALAGLLERVIRSEGMTLPDWKFDALVDHAAGSPRRLLTGLATVADLDEERAVMRLLEQQGDTPEAIDLCRALANDAGWPELMVLVKALPADNHEGTRIVVSRYLASCAMGAKNARAAQKWVRMLAAFSSPFNITDGVAPLILALGHASVGGRE